MPRTAERIAAAAVGRIEAGLDDGVDAQVLRDRLHRLDDLQGQTCALDHAAGHSPV